MDVPCTRSPPGRPSPRRGAPAPPPAPLSGPFPFESFRTRTTDSAEIPLRAFRPGLVSPSPAEDVLRFVAPSAEVPRSKVGGPPGVAPAAPAIQLGRLTLPASDSPGEEASTAKARRLRPARPLQIAAPPFGGLALAEPAVRGAGARGGGPSFRTPLRRRASSLDGSSHPTGVRPASQAGGPVEGAGLAGSGTRATQDRHPTSSRAGRACDGLAAPTAESPRGRAAGRRVEGSSPPAPRGRSTRETVRGPSPTPDLEAGLGPRILGGPPEHDARRRSFFDSAARPGTPASERGARPRMNSVIHRRAWPLTVRGLRQPGTRLRTPRVRTRCPKRGGRRGRWPERGDAAAARRASFIAPGPRGGPGAAGATARLLGRPRPDRL